MSSFDAFSTMIFPSNFEVKTGFDAIKETIRKECLSSLGVENVDKITFSSKRSFIEMQLLQTMEFKSISQLHRDFPVNHYHDLRPELKKLTVEGVYINIEALPLLLLSLKTVSDVFLFFKKAEDDAFPHLKKLAAAYYLDNNIIIKASQLIDEKGLIRDAASDRLFELRKIRKQLLKAREKRIEAIYSSWLKSGAAIDTGITIRNGRSVIPVHAAQKRQVKGFIFDESSTGQTIYIEPTELFELNNDITDNEHAEKKEIIKILTAFTDFLRPHIPELIRCYEFLGLVDFIRAKARFSIKIKATLPLIVNRPFLNWQQAIHPLLFLKNLSAPHKVVPLTLELNESQRIIIVSGPNSGGKSVCLKTVGLLQYMFQCGLPIPVDDNSVCGIFDRMFIEIGDEQSLENDLSTYSSHLRNMSFFISNCNGHTLFLIDEMGSGTEPQIGGAIAEAVIEEIHRQKAFGIVTTHYTNLKMLSQKHNGIINAAMLFDINNLEPLYILKTGEPGSSFAFEIAQKIGLTPEVIAQAKAKTSDTIVGFEEFYVKVKEKDNQLEHKMKAFEKSDEMLSSTYQKYQDLLNDIENKKQDIIEKARQDAQVILNEANKKIEHVIKGIRESQAEKEATKLLRNELQEFKEQIKPVVGAPLTDPDESLPKSKKEKKIAKAPISQPRIETDASNKPLKTGDYVIISGQTEVGIIDEIKDDVVFAVFGSLKIKTSKQKLKRVLNYKPKSLPRSVGIEMLNNITAKKNKFSMNLDLRGKRAEEALTILNNYINDAVLCQVYLVRIIHGKGDGILRPLIRQQLAINEFVKKYYDEHVELGGQGVTIVELN